MRRIFADTSYFIALFTPHDDAYTTAVRLTPTPSVVTVTSDWVIAELGNYFASSHLRIAFCDSVERIKQNPHIELLPAARADLDEGLKLYRDRPDKAWSLVDCISMSMAYKLGISDIPTTDRHFTQAGFNALLLP
jgi:predicted nucleic acid-binding protein